MNDPMLNFVKGKLEENEGISSEALARLMVSAKAVPTRRPLWRPCVLLAASLGLAVCGWFFLNDAADVRRESDLTNVIALLRVADECEESAEDASLVDVLQAWQDAPCLLSSES